MSATAQIPTGMRSYTFVTWFVTMSTLPTATPTITVYTVPR